MRNHTGYELPSTRQPELAVAGRSNVGKSTLVGALLGEPSLLRRSRRPGCTTTVNFFAVGGRRKEDATKAAQAARAFVVDLPGVGFARRSRAHKAAFGKATLEYLATRERDVLRQVLVLCDAWRAASTGPRGFLTRATLVLGSSGLCGGREHTLPVPS